VANSEEQRTFDEVAAPRPLLVQAHRSPIVPANSGSKSALGCADPFSWAAERGGDVSGILPELSRLGCGDFPALLLCVHLIDERVESAAGRTIIGRVRVGQERCDLAQGADEARLLLGRERTPDGLDQALAGVGRGEEDNTPPPWVPA